MRKEFGKLTQDDGLARTLLKRNLTPQVLMFYLAGTNID